MLDEMFTPHAPIPDSGWLDFGSPESAYGYGWMIGKEGNRRVFEHGGGIDGFVSVIKRYPDDKTTIIILSNQENTPLGAIHREITKTLFGDD
jgi:hypothetical protein